MWSFTYACPKRLSAAVTTLIRAKEQMVKSEESKKLLLGQILTTVTIDSFKL